MGEADGGASMEKGEVLSGIGTCMIWLLGEKTDKIQCPV
jgi:hypothetical protein